MSNITFGTHPSIAEDVKICVYAMCKNELKFVDRWIENIWCSGKGADYITVLDTGSSDGTYERLQELSKQYNTKEKHIIISQQTISPWRFDVARNESMKLIPSSDKIDVCYCVDLDEIVDERLWDDLRNMVFEHPNFMRIHYQYAWSHKDDGTPNWVFWYDKIHGPVGWQWEFPVHETLKCDNSSLYDDNIYYLKSDIIYLHHFPDPTKSRGNYLPLLELRAQENPYDITSQYYLTREYTYHRKWEECITQADKVFNLFSRYAVLPDSENFTYAAVLCLKAEGYDNLGKRDEAINCYKEAIIQVPTFRQSYICLAQLLAYQGLYKECYEIINCVDERAPKIDSWQVPGWVNSDWKIFQIKGDALSWEGKYQEAYEVFSTALSCMTEDEKSTASEYGFFNDLEFIDTKLQEIRNKNVWMTLLFNNEYFCAEVGLVKSLQQVGNEYQIYCLTTKDVDESKKQVLTKLGVHLIEVEPYLNDIHENYLNTHPAVLDVRERNIHWTDSLLKLNIYKLTQFEKIVYIDNDVRVVRWMDDLFNYPSISACYDMCGETEDVPCAGMLVINPNIDLYNKFISLMNDEISKLPEDKLISDNDLLRIYAQNSEVVVNRIDSKYNWWSTYADRLYDFHDVKSWHFVCEKPWDVDISVYAHSRDEFPKYYDVTTSYINFLNDCRQEVINMCGEESVYDWKVFDSMLNDDINFTIVIPYHHEPLTKLNKLFTTIENQIGYDFSHTEILICSSDGIVPEIDLTLYPNIKSMAKCLTYKYPLSGPGQSRQVGLDNARGKYIAFYDCDDMLYSFDVYYEAFKEIDRREATEYFDAIYFNYIDEVYGEVKYQIYEFGQVIPYVQWCAIYRRSALRQLNAQFYLDIAISEDVYFTLDILLKHINIIKSDILMYVHKMYKNSTGNTWLWSPNRLHDTYKLASKLVDEYVKEQQELTHYFATTTYLEAFYSVYNYTNKFSTFSDVEKESCMKEFIEYIKKYDYNLYNIDNNLDDSMLTREDIESIKKIYWENSNE